MKVKIKNYSYWFGPYQFMNWLFYPFGKEDEYGQREYPEWHDKLSERYADSWLGEVHTKLAEKWLSFQEPRRVKVNIEKWDTWNMDHTLAEIVLPMLIQLKEQKHGSPMVDDEDVPHLAKQQRSRNETNQLDMFVDEEYDKLVWKQYEVRWNWVMDEMIYAFDCKVNKDDVYMRFEDRDEMRKEQDRIANGFRLFGKYYEGLWD